ncbi:MAG: DNRLRE domain-containing protein [Ardenticatenaceae bacterium]|nr:DNRLRE domain-containing protein [Anaerolineales bacterium]MCB8937489.1 DNRLRE domain-containing protein [Ardenticatenaceae bacterium]MCB8975530.1 DNRLRE domain-containing protein [Ardenticatenaceae bacterium]
MKGLTVKNIRLVLLTFLLGLPLLLGASEDTAVLAEPSGPAVTRRVNVPFTTGVEPDIPVPDRAILWYGEVGPTTQSYTDVRLIYNSDKLHVVFHIIDQYLYYDPTPTAGEMPNWDAATLYLDLDGASGGAPDANSYQFIGQLDALNANQQAQRPNYDFAYVGNGSGWTEMNLAFETAVGTQTETGLNNQESDAGWNITFRIPWSSLGLSGPPANGTVWGLGLTTHDEDGTAHEDRNWPEGLSSNSPATWGQMRFGLPTYTPPSGVTGSNTVTIRQGENGANVPDGQVGGGTDCGGPPPLWGTWGNFNYAGDFQMNVQNQWNLGDWGCFSKYYVTFPLDSLPADQAVLSANLTMYHFGNSDPSLAQPSLIQVFTVDADWNESTLVWNNAPMAVENVARTWVNPLPAGGAGQFVTWDLSGAVAEAYASGQPLRLALYSADNARHSGKYFSASETFVPDRRPTLEITYGSLYGFSLSVDQVVQTAVPGTSAQFQLTVTPTGGFNMPVTFQASNVPAGVSVNIPLGDLTPPGSKTITISHTNAAQTAGAIYKVPIVVSGDGVDRTINLYLLVNGSQSFLPIIQK